MSQEQPQGPGQDQFQRQEPIKYGDVFSVSGELAEKPIAPKDAATVQEVESIVLGKTQKGGPASVMQSAAENNVRAGLVGTDSAKDAAREKGVSFSRSGDRGNSVIAEFIGGQVVGQFVAPRVPPTHPGTAPSADAITIGEALEAAAISAGDKAVDQTDAAAVQAAETKATYSGGPMPGGVAAAAQAAATRNERTMSQMGKITLSDVLTDATEKLPRDKRVALEDAEGVIGAELRNNPEMRTTPSGVAESLAAAARLNHKR